MEGHRPAKTLEDDVYPRSVERKLRFLIFRPLSSILTCVPSRPNPHLSSQPALSPTERALYAALAPSPQTAAPLHAACRTWADRLWALVCVTCEERVSSGLARLEDVSFWEGGVAAVEGKQSQRVEVGDVEMEMETDTMQQAGKARQVEDDEEGEEEEWEKEVLGALEGLSHIAVEDG